MCEKNCFSIQFSVEIESTRAYIFSQSVLSTLAFFFLSILHTFLGVFGSHRYRGLLVRLERSPRNRRVFHWSQRASERINECILPATVSIISDFVTQE